MRTTCHLKSKDVLTGHNLTQNVSFKFEKLSDEASRRIEIISGLAINKIQVTIRINGLCKINKGDKVNVLGKDYKALAFDSHMDQQLQGHYRKDYQNFRGYTIIGLE